MTKTLVASAVLVMTFAGVAPVEEAAISRAITDIAAGADRHDWARVRDAFAQIVTTDYTSLWGGDAVSQSADALIEGWAAFLPGFDVTHHMVTNHTISLLSEDTAKAEADFTATHRIDDKLWVLGGRYSYDLVKVEAQWQVSALTMTALWESGDRALVGVAAERAAAGQ